MSEGPAPPSEPSAKAAEPSAKAAKQPAVARPQRRDSGGIAQAVLDAAPSVDDGWSDEQLAHPSSMVERPGLLARWFGWLFFSQVRFPDPLHRTLASCAREGVPVYVMNRVSLLDFVYLNYALLARGLPIARYASDVKASVVQPAVHTLRTWLRRLLLERRSRLPRDAEVMRAWLRRRRPVLVFLRRGFSFTALAAGARRRTHHLRELIAAQREVDFPIFVVPQLLIWSRDADRSRTSIVDSFFGEPQAPGPLRKLFSFVVNFRRAFMWSSEPIDLRAFLDEQTEEVDDATLAERLRHLIIDAIRTEDRVIRGRPALPPRAMATEILAGDDFTAELQRICAATEQPLPEAQAEARRAVLEMAADFRIGAVDAIGVMLTLIWARIYEGIDVDEEGMERVRAQGREAPVVIVPSHKSHIDYLVISYLFYRYGLIPPHIAAGVNMSFWPMGPIFRRCGAFFLRRSFRGQAVYAATFRAYVRELLRQGHWIEFFPEGTRSRTGKLLPPRFGLLRLILEAVADGVTEDVRLMPTNFGYERLIEESAYRKELEGGEKKAESAAGLLSATQVLVHKYGRLRVQFAEPISVRALLTDHGVLDADGKRIGDEAALQRVIKVSGYQILHGINDAAVITSTAIVAAVLLGKLQRGISREDLSVRAGYLVDLASRRGAVLAAPLTHAVQSRRKQLQLASTQDVAEKRESGGVPDPLGKQGHRARAMGAAIGPLVENVLRIFEEPGWVVRKRFDTETEGEQDGTSSEIIITKRAGRLHLEYYKNNMLHLFVTDALLAAAVLGLTHEDALIDPVELRESTKFLSRLLKFEFVYDPSRGFDAEYEQTLRAFRDAGWLRDRESGVALAHKVVPVVQLYAQMLQSFVESYLLVGRALESVRDNPMAEKAFLGLVQKRAKQSFELGEVYCYEAVSRVNLTNALRIYVEQGYARQAVGSDGKTRTLVVDSGEDTSVRLAGFVMQIERFHAPWRNT